MNKIKMAFIAIAILAAVGGAFATRRCAQCEYSDQYIAPEGPGSYQLLTGMYGREWDCEWSAGICTYYRPDPIGQPNSYAPCRTGTWTPIW